MTHFTSTKQGMIKHVSIGKTFEGNINPYVDTVNLTDETILECRVHIGVSLGLRSAWPGRLGEMNTEYHLCEELQGQVLSVLLMTL